MAQISAFSSLSRSAFQSFLKGHLNNTDIFLRWTLRGGLTYPQCTKKVVSDSPGPVDFAIGLVNSVPNLPDRQVKYFEEFNLHKKCEINSAHRKHLRTRSNDVWACKC